MHRGYVKFWRKSLESGLLQNAEAWQLMTWCLLKASHKKHQQVVGKQIVELNPGEFVYGRKMATAVLKSSDQKIRTSLKLLENMNFLTIKSTNKYSVIAVVNWGTYQQDQPTNNQQSNQPATNNQPTINHKQECKELKACEEQQLFDKPEPPKKTKTEIEYPSWLDIEKFNEFIQDRKERKCPATPRAINGLITALEKACDGNYGLQSQIIDKATVNSWKSFFKLRPDEIVPDPTQEEGYMSPQQIHDNIRWDNIAKIKAGEM